MVPNSRSKKTQKSTRYVRTFFSFSILRPRAVPFKPATNDLAASFKDFCLLAKALFLCWPRSEHVHSSRRSMIESIKVEPSARNRKKLTTNLERVCTVWSGWFCGKRVCGVDHLVRGGSSLLLGCELLCFGVRLSILQCGLVFGR
jgi:hypothetical protein